MNQKNSHYNETWQVRANCKRSTSDTKIRLEMGRRQIVKEAQGTNLNEKEEKEEKNHRQTYYAFVSVLLCLNASPITAAPTAPMLF